MVAFLFPEYLEEVRLENQTYGAFASGWLHVLEVYREAIAACCIMALLAELVAGDGAAPTGAALPVGGGDLGAGRRGSCRRRAGPTTCCRRSSSRHCFTIAAAALAPRLRLPAERQGAATVLVMIGVFGLALALRPVDEALADSKARFSAQPLIKTLQEVAPARR
jgi:hypothetical protein